MGWFNLSNSSTGGLGEAGKAVNPSDMQRQPLTPMEVVKDVVEPLSPPCGSSTSLLRQALISKRGKSRHSSSPPPPLSLPSAAPDLSSPPPNFITSSSLSSPVVAMSGSSGYASGSLDPKISPDKSNPDFVDLDMFVYREMEKHSSATMNNNTTSSPMSATTLCSSLSPPLVPLPLNPPTSSQTQIQQLTSQQQPQPNTDKLLNTIKGLFKISLIISF